MREKRDLRTELQLEQNRVAVKEERTELVYGPFGISLIFPDTLSFLFSLSLTVSFFFNRRTLKEEERGRKEEGNKIKKIRRGWRV